jgi:hypothetical protein
MADEYAGCHCCLDVLRLARCQLERNRIFDLGCRCYGVFPRQPIDKSEPAGHRPADDFIVHPNLGLNGVAPEIACSDEEDTAETRLQWWELKGRLIEAAWTRATRQQEYDKQKRQRPGFRPHMPRLDIEKRPVPNRRTTNEWVIAPRFPRPKGSLGTRALIVQDFFSLCAISVTARVRLFSSQKPDVPGPYMNTPHSNTLSSAAV